MRFARHRRALGGASSVTVLAVAIVTLVGMLAIPAHALSVGGFEIDADQVSPAAAALYSGTDTPTSGDDWAQGASGHGAFVQASGATGTAATGCYGSNVDLGTIVTGAAAFICDGNSDSKFRNSEPEQNIVSPSGKSPDASYPIKPGNVRPKNDFSHAYSLSSIASSPCDGDNTADDIILRLGGHRGDNEGDAFWGFEFDRTKPTNFDKLVANDGQSFTLGMNRQIGDIFVSFTVTSAAVILELFRVTGFNSDGSAIFTLAPAQPGCPHDQPQGLSRLATNDGHDVKAPPWNIPVCDPTADNAANTCRLANGTTSAEDLIASRDFAEASVDLTAFGITDVCLTNVIFTSRSAHPLTGADVQDIGGGNFNLCGKKSGQKFEDLNGDGIHQPTEPGIAGWPIQLYNDINGNHSIDTAAELATLQTTTTADGTNGTTLGNYQFSNLQPGNYVACEGTQTGWNQSFPRPGTGIVTCPNGTRGYSFLMTGADHTGNDFGNFRNGTVSGFKFKDKADNGADNAGDTRLGGWTISISGTSNLGVAVSQTAVTGDGTGGTTLGAYSFSVPPGDYLVCEVLQSNWVEAFPTSGADCSGTAGNGPLGYSVTVGSNGSVGGKNFGNSPLSTITVNFNPLVTGKTHATSISCVDKDGTSVGSSTNSNTVTTSNVRVRQSSVVCTVTYVDP